VEKIKAALKNLLPLPPLILGGDLNARRESEVFRKILEEYLPLADLGPVEGCSFASPDKGYEARIDFLLGCGVKPVASGIIDSSGSSDHHLVWAECEL
jgi:endonuclease/exonuclease/phosphatase (EEP) superfamily protein YafD